MLELHDVTKRYGGRTVVDRVAFSVAPGALTGFVGANGAGKTTTMRVVLGIAPPDAGEVRFAGRPVDAAARRRFGYMPEERGLYPKTQVRRQLVHLARLHGVERRTAEQRTDALLERLGLAERARDPLEALSLGNQQRAQIAAALVHDPVLLLLDEPFSGLDPVAVDELAALLREQAQAGVPVLFSSHQLGLVEQLCDRVVVLAAGRVVADGTVPELRAARGTGRVRLHVEPGAGFVRDLAGTRVLQLDGAHAVVETADPQQLLRAALAAGTLHAFAPDPPSLAELFRSAVEPGADDGTDDGTNGGPA